MSNVPVLMRLHDLMTGAPDADVVARIDAMKAELFALPEGQRQTTDWDLSHMFAPGVYARTLRIPRGQIIVGKIHRHAHLNFIQSGRIAVFSKDGTYTYGAPMQFVSSPGTQRVVFALADTVWTTIHDNPTNTQDLAEIERHVIAPTYEALAHETQGVLL